MYKIYFENRFIEIIPSQEISDTEKNQKLIRYKNKKSFYKAVKNFKKDTNIVRMLVVSDKPKKVFKQLKKMFTFIPAAGGLVINQEGKLLIIRRNDQWDLPKGKIEKGEKKRSAALREVEEECGISNLSIKHKIKKTYHTYEAYGKKVFKTTHWYLMEYHGNEPLTPQTKEGITEALWKNKNELEEIKSGFYASLQELVDDYLNRTASKY